MAQSTETGGTTALRVLSLDGGGVRGYSSLLILRQVMREIQAQEKLERTPKPCDYFDVIAGTSTGGLIAIMLGRLRMDVESCILKYEELSWEIFKTGFWKHLPGVRAFDGWAGKPWFSGGGLADAVKNVVAKNLSPAEADELKRKGTPLGGAGLWDPSPTNVCKTFVVTVRKVDNVTVNLRSYQKSTDEPIDTCAIWEAARATSAAPIYFPVMTIAGEEYFDGGLTNNNPIFRLKDECEDGLNSPVPRCIVSIGTGRVAKTNDDRGFFSKLGKWLLGGYGRVGWALLGIMQDTQAKHLMMITDKNNKKFATNYYRFNVVGDIGSVGLDEWQKLPLMKQETAAYLQEEQTVKWIKECAAKLMVK